MARKTNRIASFRRGNVQVTDLTGQKNKPNMPIAALAKYGQSALSFSIGATMNAIRQSIGAEVSDQDAKSLELTLNNLPTEEEMYNRMRLIASNIKFDANGKISTNLPSSLTSWIKQSGLANFQLLKDAIGGKELNAIQQDAIQLQFLPKVSNRLYARFTEHVVNKVINEEYEALEDMGRAAVMAAFNDGMSSNSSQFSSLIRSFDKQKTAGDKQAARNAFNYSDKGQVGPFTVELKSAFSPKQQKADAVSSIVTIDANTTYNYRPSVKAWDTLSYFGHDRSFGSAFVIDVIGRMADTANLSGIIWGLASSESATYINSIKKMGAYDILLGASQEQGGSANCLVIRNNSNIGGQKFRVFSTNDILKRIDSIGSDTPGVTLSQSIAFAKQTAILDAIQTLTVAKVAVASGFLSF